MTDTVYGIDLGTTYSAIAFINDMEIPEIIQNFDGNQTTPSVVYFESPGNATVGEEAKRSAMMEPDDTCMLIKRHMGTEHPQIFQGETYTPESISAMILRTLVESANEQLGKDVKKVVVTVPAYFGVQEREATQQAGTIAGLDVIGIVTEPVAAALSVGASSDVDETIMIYDLGGGTFDTTVMRLGSGNVEVLAVEGDRELGGADWDETMSAIVCDKFIEATGIDDDPLADEDFAVDLQLKVEDAKKSLTKRAEATIPLQYDGHRQRVTITREEFEQATSHLVERTIEIAKRSLETAKKNDPAVMIDRVLLVGGSSRMPMISEALRERLNWDPQPTDFDLAVAKGAAIYGQAAANGVLLTGDQDIDEVEKNIGEAQRFLPGQATSLNIQNVLARSVGLCYQRSESEELYIDFFAHANDQIPQTPETVSAGTVVDRQTKVNISIYEQGGDAESEIVDDNRLLKDATLEIPRDDLPKGSALEISFNISGEGLITVHVKEPSTGVEVELEAAVSVLDAEQVAAETEKVSAMMLRS